MRFFPLIAALALAALPAAAQTPDATSAQAVKRYLLMRLNDRCGLLDAPASVALKAGYVQARNAAIRAGHEMSSLRPWLDQADAAAASADCRSQGIATEMAYAQNAYRTFVVQMKLDLPGIRGAWTAVRTHQDDAQWRLVQYQNSPDADLAFGLYGTLGDNALSVMARLSDGAHPYAARLWVRDPNRVAVGVIDPAPYAVSSRAPVGFSTMGSASFAAYGETGVSTWLHPSQPVNFAGFALGGTYVGAQTPVAAQRFDFPKAAIVAMARLDPREEVVIQFDCDDGPRYARFEIGDLIAGVAYLSLPSPWSHAN
ncbi:MAG: hypothetical protein ACXU8U_02390 [Asticcacaulis sp.]